MNSIRSLSHKSRECGGCRGWNSQDFWDVPGFPLEFIAGNIGNSFGRKEEPFPSQIPDSHLWKCPRVPGAAPAAIPGWNWDGI